MGQKDAAVGLFVERPVSGLRSPACFRHLSGLVHGRIMLGGKTMLLDLQAVRRQKVYTEGI